jgi:hypothetical protein
MDNVTYWIMLISGQKESPSQMLLHTSRGSWQVHTVKTGISTIHLTVKNWGQKLGSKTGVLSKGTEQIHLLNLQGSNIGIRIAHRWIRLITAFYVM